MLLLRGTCDRQIVKVGVNFLQGVVFDEVIHNLLKRYSISHENIEKVDHLP